MNSTEMKDCWLSIITITKNNREGLSKTLESVRWQDYQYIEHIVIDGDSTDGTIGLLDSYNHAKQFSYLSEPDVGISDAFNKGLYLSKGTLVYFLNAGDVLVEKDTISRVIGSYLVTGWKCAEGKTITSSYSGKKMVYSPPKLSSHFLHYFMFLPHQGFFCEASLHKQFQYDETITTSMDYDLFIRMLKGIEICYLPFIISEREPGGISSRGDLRVKEFSEIRLKHARNSIDRGPIVLINALTILKNKLKIDSPFSKGSLKKLH